ncbi:MAG TPA: hypothetical protein VJ846_11370, partial [Sphingomicrobium sp.]|nr:hypothetical protein [Sphingomicrobium sp.]
GRSGSRHLVFFSRGLDLRLRVPRAPAENSVPEPLLASSPLGKRAAQTTHSSLIIQRFAANPAPMGMGIK